MPNCCLKSVSPCAPFTVSLWSVSGVGVVPALGHDHLGVDGEVALPARGCRTRGGDVRIVRRERDVLAVHVDRAALRAERAGDVDLPLLRRRRREREALHDWPGERMPRASTSSGLISREERLHGPIGEADPPAAEDEGATSPSGAGRSVARAGGRRRPAAVRARRRLGGTRGRPNGGGSTMPSAVRVTCTDGSSSRTAPSATRIGPPWRRRATRAGRRAPAARRSARRGASTNGEDLRVAAGEMQAVGRDLSAQAERVRGAAGAPRSSRPASIARSAPRAPP